MSENYEQIQIELTLNADQAKTEVDHLSNMAESLPNTLENTKQNLQAVASDMRTVLSFADSNNGIFNRLPEQFRLSMEQMVRVARTYMRDINHSINSSSQEELLDTQMTKRLDQRIGVLSAYSKNIIAATQNMEKLSANLSKSAMTELNHTIVDMQRALLETSSHISSKNKLGATSDKVISSVFMRQKANQAGLQAAGQALGFDVNQQKLLLDTLIKAQVPAYQRSDFFNSARKFSNGSLVRQNTFDQHLNYKDRLPDAFKHYFDGKQTSIATTVEKYAEQLTKDEYRTVQKLAATNHTFRESLIAAGLGEYGVKGRKAGTFLLPSSINRHELAVAEGYLMRDKLRPALEGTPLYFASLQDQSEHSQKRLASRQSRAALESLSALHTLQNVNVGISPIAPIELESARKNINNNFSRVSAGRIGTIRPDQYVVMSLTPDDFKKGVIPSKDKYSSEILDLDKLDGKSGFKTLTRSQYTDLAGMFGHNTAGNGVRGDIDLVEGMFDAAKMLIVDYNDKMFKKDANGDLVWRKDKSGLPEFDENTIKELEKLFIPNASLSYGDGKTYQYHAETRSVNGKNIRYVPTNTKGGGVVFVNEDAYIKHAKASLEEFGVNVFDNMVHPDQLYEWQNDANKNFEARNRILTPSIPLSEIGGRLPSIDKIAFVDMSKLNKDDDTEFGHDGSMFFMPGYIPGGAGTMRIGSIIKGVGQTVDYKKIIRDAYKLKNGDPFYLPGLNITDELRQQFREGGLENIRNIYGEEYSQILDRYFVDVMKYDALIPDSVIKSPILRQHGIDNNAKLDNSEAQNVLMRYLNIVGEARMVQTAEGFKTHGKPFLSAQIAQSLELTDEQLKASSEAAQKYIYDLQNNVDAQLKYVFTDKNNLLDQQIHANPSLIEHSVSAQERINEAVKAAQTSLLKNEVFAQGLNFMELALANPGEWVLKYGALNNLLIPDNAKGHHLANVLSLANGIAGINIKDKLTVGAARYPNNQSEEFSLSVNNSYVQRLKRYGMDHPGVYMNAETIAKMGGGDFDGDTIQLVFDWLQQAFASTEQIRGDQLAAYKNRFSSKPEKLSMPDDKKLQAKQIAEAVYRQGAASIAMGSVSKAMDALDQGNWSDQLWVKTVGSGALDLKAIYDIDSVFAKTGVLRQWSAEAKNAKRMGVPFQYLVKNLESALENNDFSKMEKMSNVNYPSIFSHGTYAALMGMQNTPMSNSSLNKLIEAQATLEGFNMTDIVDIPETAEQARAKYLYDNIRVMSQILTGRASGSVSKEDREALRADLEVWRSFLGTSVSPEEEAKYAQMDKEIKAQESRLSHLDLFGISQEAIESNRGYARLFRNIRYTGQQSAFQVQKDEITEEAARTRDLRNLQILGGLMADPTMQKALSSMIKPYELAAGKQKADDMTYSYSMVDRFMGLDMNNPDRQSWYNQYILGNIDPGNAHTALGSAFHSVLQKWAEARIANQRDSSNQVMGQEDLIDAFNKELGDKYSKHFTLKDGRYAANDLSIQKKLDNAYESIGNLVNLFEDEDIIAAEALLANYEVKDEKGNILNYEQDGKRPYIYFGQQAGDSSQELKSIGYVDLITRKRKPGEGAGQATGEMIVTDAKADLVMDKHRTQLAAYAGAVGADKVRLLSYQNMRTSEQRVTPEMIERANDALQEGAKEIQLMGAITGFNPKAMRAIPSTLKLSQISKTQDPYELLQKEREREQEERRKLLYPTYSGSRMHIRSDGTVGVESRNRYENQGDLTDAQYDALKRDILEIDPNSGKALAKEMSLQTDMMNYVHELQKIQSDLLSKTIPRDPDRIKNPWDGYERALNDRYKARRDAYKVRGATDFDLATLDAEQRTAQQNYDIALRSRASLDIIDLNQKLKEDLSAADGKTSVSKYSQQFKELTREIQSATMAYETLKKKVESADSGKANPDDVAALSNAEKEYVLMQALKDQREDQIRRKSIEAFNIDASAMSDIAKLGELSADTKIEEQVRKLKLRQENNILQAETDLESKLITQEEYNRRVNAMEAIDVDAYEKRLRQELYTNTNEKYAAQIDSLSRSVSHSDPFARLKQQSDDFQNRIDDIRSNLNREFKLGNINESDYKTNLDKLQNLAEAISPSKLGILKLGDSITRAFSQLGRQVFHKAINEVKRFVVEYDAAMTDIQMVTLKTDEEIQTLSDNILNIALDLKANPTSIASAATDLYRQGLSDEAVDSRLTDVIKFATVSKVKVSDAIKMITVAMNDETIESAEEVMDIITALGDTAATEVEQITKGMQKSHAAALEVGVTTAELMTMLTVITSKTQLSGNVAGTTLRNVFGRMSRYSKDGYIQDGNTRYAKSDVAVALRSAGIDIEDENGEMRSGFQILSELGSVWEGLSDNIQRTVTNVLAGTEHFSNFAALMSGFSDVDENGMTWIQRYMTTANTASGTVDQKYGIYEDSWQASVQNLKTSLDAFGQSISDVIDYNSFLDFIADAINGFTKLTTACEGAIPYIAMLGTSFAALMLIPGFKEIAAVLLGIGFVGKGINWLAKTLTQTDADVVNEQYNSYNTKINEAKRLNNKLQQNGSLSDVDTQKLSGLLTELSDLGLISSEAVTAIDKLAESADATSVALNGASKAADDKRTYELAKLAASEITPSSPYNTPQNDGFAEGAMLLSSLPIEEYEKNFIHTNPSALAFINSIAHQLDLENGAVWKSGLTSSQILNPEIASQIKLLAREYSDLRAYSAEDVMSVLQTVPEIMDTGYADAAAPIFAKMLTELDTGSGNFDPWEKFFSQFFSQDGSFDVNSFFKVLSVGAGDNWQQIVAERTIQQTVPPEQTRYDLVMEAANRAKINSKSSDLDMAMMNLVTTFYQAQGKTIAERIMNAVNSDNFPIESIESIFDEYNDLGLAYNELINNPTQGKYDEFLMIGGNKVQELAGLVSYQSNAKKQQDASQVSAALMSSLNPLTIWAALSKQMQDNFLQVVGDDLGYKFVLGTHTPTDDVNAQKRISEFYNASAVTKGQIEYDNANVAQEIFTYLRGMLSLDSASDSKTYLDAYGDQSALYDFLKDYPLLGAAIRSYANGENWLNQDQLGVLMNDAQYGAERGQDFYSIAPDILFGEKWRTGDATYDLSRYGSFTDSEFGSTLLEEMDSMSSWQDVMDEMNSSMSDHEVNTDRCNAAMKKFNDQFASDNLARMLKYEKAMEKAQRTLNNIQLEGADAAQAYNDLYASALQYANANYAFTQYKKGDRSQKTVSVLSDYFDWLDETQLKKASGKEAAMYIDNIEKALADESSQLDVVLNEVIGSKIAEYQNQTFANIGTTIDLGKFVVNGTVDAQGIADAFAGAGVIVDSSLTALLATLASINVGITATTDGQNVQLNTENITKKSYGGSSGGSKKSKADKLVERQDYGKSLYEHQIKMVQYEQTKYENADELSNYGKMLEEEIEIERAYLPVLESNIAALRSELGNVKEGSEDWYKLRDAILEAEEQYADINNTIEENEKKLEENHQAILKLHTDLEEMVVGEIELRIDAEKEMLDGSVSMQETVLNAIKQRYQDEWDLIKQDIEKKKEALQQEKDLIDERLDARRDAEDEAAKYEELAELKKQLSLISMDSTRTKDAAALRESIAELEKEIGWDIAEKEAENEKNAIQDQIDAYDDYVTKGDEDMDELLSDANNFAEEVNGVMKLNQTELFDWLKQNVKEYSQSLDDAQKQMVQSWEATYKQMLGITDTYWDEVNAILSSKDVFLEYMKQSNEYIYASEDERAQLLYQWEEAYDKWRKAQKNDADYSHGDSGLGDWSGSEYTGSSSGSSGGSGSSSTTNNQYTGTPNESGWASSQYSENNYRVEGSTADGKPLLSYNDSLETAKAAAASTSKSTGKPVSIYSPDGKLMYKYINGQAIAYGTTAQASGASGNSNAHWKFKIHQDGKVVKETPGFTSREKAQTAAAEYIKKNNLSGAKYTTHYYKKGGIADYTGFAWLDGTPTEPERILSADQNRDFETLVDIMSDFRNAGVPMDALRGMARWSSMVSVPSSLSHIGNAAYQGNSANIGDIFVNITEAQISDDRDIEVLANIVGEKFVKEIGKQGFNVSRYNF